MSNANTASSSTTTNAAENNNVPANAVRNKWIKRGIYAVAFIGGAYIGHKFRSQIQGVVGSVVGGAADAVSTTAEVVADTAS